VPIYENSQKLTRNDGAATPIAQNTAVDQSGVSCVYVYSTPKELDMGLTARRNLAHYKLPFN